ncbi:type B 50S ribosomal protein L31 [Streptomyces phaeochromogenes]|uniref:type B 50S ribosomal protein L31 n=1 Tax=Streptomyces phaeochromogenes TaxID=1923 RepID=UPI0006E140DC|nr:type B 50S ribosomal protein L31 [Streptomyces phaeochromogenes]MCX5605309.1 type B 50S ribosomal protein L31 [Streptomyces phaeochromogenes]WRZ31404.1 type B 50S ribosomal protein L31 [Streptomyces phaeochromogenes]WSJ06230.1 type B 50S ribosomal protein L31 [Streptomyces phaeochromogenes]
MREEIHPAYGPVVFRDRAANHAFLTRSTLVAGAGGRTIEWEDGNTYPVVDVEISNVSHPFYTGTARVMDTAGRVERFERRFGRRDDRSAGERADRPGDRRGER